MRRPPKRMKSRGNQEDLLQHRIGVRSVGRPQRKALLIKANFIEGGLITSASLKRSTALSKNPFEPLAEFGSLMSLALRPDLSLRPKSITSSSACTVLLAPAVLLLSRLARRCVYHYWRFFSYLGYGRPTLMGFSMDPLSLLIRSLLPPGPSSSVKCTINYYEEYRWNWQKEKAIIAAFAERRPTLGHYH
jgi:hypothetical protein